ncbi:DUF599 domain-containing protein [Polaromonas sp. CG_9.11]|uniref:DUF599 domain-containing protein n=1 Tax=Polaromonas sp. CG_9.11 TaxID=2787730 RepID=UPI0018CB863E|nr:DUF599 domain-containing protein [Polaromonas sp. CG_9.11]
MIVTTTWLAAFATVATLLFYEAAVLLTQQRKPERLARSAHALLREEWFAAVSSHPGSEILAVQTLRNSLMSATMTASTAVLGLMGTVTLAAPSLRSSLGDAGAGGLAFTPRLALELMLMTLLFASLVCSAMAVRYYNHASFICAMPVGSAPRQRWSASGTAYVRRAGMLYSWGLRHLVMVAPIVVFIVHPLAGPVAALVVVAAVLRSFDRASSASAASSDLA